MKGHGTKYPRKREQVVLALLTQPSIGEAAQAAGVSEVICGGGFKKTNLSGHTEMQNAESWNRQFHNFNR